MGTWKVEMVGLWFEATSGKKLARPYLKEQAIGGGTQLQFQLLRRCRLEDRSMRQALGKNQKTLLENKQKGLQV
jgi:hypothetical protein